MRIDLSPQFKKCQIYCLSVRKKRASSVNTFGKLTIQRPMVTVCAIAVTKVVLNFHHTLCLCVYFDAHNKNNNTINSLKRLVFINTMGRVLCEVGSEFLRN